MVVRLALTVVRPVSTSSCSRASLREGASCLFAALLPLLSLWHPLALSHSLSLLLSFFLSCLLLPSLSHLRRFMRIVVCIHYLSLPFVSAFISLSYERAKIPSLFILGIARQTMTMTARAPILTHQHRAICARSSFFSISFSFSFSLSPSHYFLTLAVFSIFIFSLALSAILIDFPYLTFHAPSSYFFLSLVEISITNRNL